MTRRLHQWTGIVLGIPLVLLSISGASLVYREKIERAAKPAPLRVDPRGRPALPLDEAAARILTQHPGFRLTHLQIPPRPNGPLEVVLRRGPETRFLAVDPFTGADLGLLRGGLPTPLEPVRRMHANWLLGPAGRQFNGFLSLVLAALVVTGLWLFLRGARPWHSWAGLVVALPLLLTAVSGAMLIWARPAPVEAPATGTAPALPLDAYARAAREALPGATLSWIALGDPVTVRMRLPSDWQRRGSNDIHLHPASADVLRVDLYRDAPLSRRFSVALTAIHYAEWGGATGRFLWTLIGLSVPLLWVTGLGALVFRTRLRS